MPRKRKHGVDLPPHVHRVEAKGKVYHFYQLHRGTSRQGERIALPKDPESVEFWSKLRSLQTTVPGYSGTVAAMIDAYLASPEFEPGKLADSTRRSYTLYLGHAREVLGKHSPEAIRPVHVIALRDRYKETPVAANTIIAALSAVYKWGRPRDFALVNPCEKLPKFDGGAGHKPWPQEMIDLVIEKARWEVRRFVLLTLFTGQREGDVCRMSLRDVENGLIRVVQEKTKKELWIPIDRRLMPVIEECRLAGTIHLIPRGNGEPFDANQFRAMWGREMKKADLKPIRQAGLVPHGLCKNAHEILFAAGNSEKEVGSVTGRSPQMVQYYGKGTNQKALARQAVKRSEDAETVLQSTRKGKQNQ